MWSDMTHGALCDATAGGCTRLMRMPRHDPSAEGLVAVCDAGSISLSTGSMQKQPP